MIDYQQSAHLLCRSTPANSKSTTTEVQKTTTISTLSTPQPAKIEENGRTSTAYNSMESQPHLASKHCFLKMRIELNLLGCIAISTT